jgi:hypothetical protein
MGACNTPLLLPWRRLTTAATRFAAVGNAYGTPPQSDRRCSKSRTAESATPHAPASPRTNGATRVRRGAANIENVLATTAGAAALLREVHTSDLRLAACRAASGPEDTGWLGARVT